MLHGRPRPRTLLLVADALRFDALATCTPHAGGTRRTCARTPRIDALAAGGVVFRRHYANALPCGPSRTSLLTGLYALTHGVVTNETPFDTRLATLPATLRAGGFPSYLVGYTDTVAPPFVGPGEGVMPGFEVHTHFNLNGHGLRSWVSTLEARGLGPFADPRDAFVPVTGRRALYGREDSDTAFVADRTIACMREHRDEPWLLMASFLRPHSPWVAPPPYDTLYEGHDWPLLGHATRPGPAAHPLLETMDAKPDAGIRACYLGLVTELDAQVGRVLDALDDLGLAGDTLVILTSDHGEMLGDHGSWGSRSFFEPAIHLPLVVRPGAGTGPPHVVDGVTEVVDVAPTVLDWMGAGSLPLADGASLLPALTGGPAPARTASFTEFALPGPAGRPDSPSPAPQRVVHVWGGDRHKYVRAPGLPPLLLDTRDPAEPPVEPDGDLVSHYRGELLDHRRRHATRP